MDQQQSTTTATKLSTAIVIIVAVIVFGVAMLAIFSSPIKQSSDEPTAVETIE